MGEVEKDWRTIIMKKRLLTLILAVVFCMTLAACGDDENTEKVDELAKVMQEMGTNGIITPSQSVMNAMAKEWCVVDSDDIYVMEADGTGTKNGTEFTFECGFNKDNKITIHMDFDGEEEVYTISTDETGYGVILKGVGSAEDKVLLPADLEFLSLDDERIAGLAGDWKDASGNVYKLKDNFKLKIDGVNNDSKGTYSVVQTADGAFRLNLVINGSAYEYEFVLDAAKGELELWGADSDTDTTHIWTK